MRAVDGWRLGWLIHSHRQANQSRAKVGIEKLYPASLQTMPSANANGTKLFDISPLQHQSIRIR
jgi:hypothetical protein